MSKKRKVEKHEIPQFRHVENKWQMLAWLVSGSIKQLIVLLIVVAVIIIVLSYLGIKISEIF